jgi:hypothetical protein
MPEDDGIALLAQPVDLRAEVQSLRLMVGAFIDMPLPLGAP